MVTDVLIKNLMALTSDQVAFATLLAKQLGDGLKEIRCREVSSVKICVQRGGDKSPFQQGLGYPIEFSVELLDKAGESISIITVWVFANTLDGWYKLNWDGHEETQDSQRVIDETFSHLIARIKGF